MKKVSDTTQNLKVFQPGDMKRKIFIFLCIYGTLLIYSSIFLHTRIHYFKDLNLEHRNYTLKNLNAIDPPFIEPYVAAIWPKLEDKKFFHEKGPSSTIVKEVAQQIPEIESALNGAIVDDAFELFLLLRSKAEFGTELKAMRYFMGRFDKAYLDEYIDYLYRYLYIPLQNSFDSCQIAKAEWISGQIRERLQIIDPDPLNRLDTYSSLKYNQMLLNNIVFYDMKEVYTQPLTAKKFFPISYNRRLTLPKDSTAVADTFAFKSLRRYWNALQVFRDKRYLECVGLFNTMKNEVKPRSFAQICALMEARSLFWAIDRDMIPRDMTNINRIKFIADSMQASSFQTDAQYYYYALMQNTYQNPVQSSYTFQQNNTGRSNWLSPNDEFRISQEDIIDALIEVLKIKKRIKTDVGEPYYRYPNSYSPTRRATEITPSQYQTVPMTTQTGIPRKPKQ